MTLSDLAAGLPGDTALLAPNRQALTYGGLAAQVERTGRLLKQLGFGPHHCIAVLLPNGPELASAFLSISSGAAFAPLNPAYSVTEFKFYLEDLQAAALATIPGYCPAAEEAAKSLGIGLLRLTPDTAQPAGTFDLSGEGIGKSLAARESERRFALLLHSSGTTARPKLVGLTHENLAASAQAIAKTLRLGPGDIGLNVMPLFHIHGLAGSLLSSLLAGSSVYCPPAFNALSFAGWMAESRATWYTAVPSMHQVLLSRPDAVANLRGHVRFVRSSSAHLHTRVWQEMEARYECPVLNTYGMTEASHQVASNPLPPGQRKYGSTGPAGGPEIAILNELGEPQPAGTAGEVGIRGRNVATGYVVPAEANHTAFTNGWFRTGDEGVMDAGGYLTLTGRLKELINSGGEKISPAEVDAALMQHPAVTQAVTFGVKCEIRGERVYSAVVLQGDATESGLKHFARERLAAFKTPSKVLIVLEIPKGPTGKMQRAGMAKILGLE